MHMKSREPLLTISTLLFAIVLLLFGYYYVKPTIRVNEWSLIGCNNFSLYQQLKAQKQLVSTITIPDKFIPTNGTDIYLWKPDRHGKVPDIQDIEHKIYTRLKYGVGEEDSKYVLYVVNGNYGFGNQFRSLLGCVIIALASGRRLRIDWDEYYTITNSSFNGLRKSSSEVLPINRRTWYVFKNGFCTMNLFKSHDISLIFPHDLTIINTFSDISCLTSDNDEYTQIFNSLGLYTYGPNPRAILARLFLQPSDELRNVIFRYLNNYDFRNSVGIQLRLGGNIANTMESKRFLSYLTSRDRIREIDNAEQDSFRFLFITTDATKLIRGTDLDLNMTVIETHDYSACHSSVHFGNPNYHDCLKRAVVDAILLSRCDHMYHTYGSSYGRLCHWLSYNKNNKEINEKGIV